MAEVLVSHSVDETLTLGEKFAARLRGGDIVALRGDLGSGKTHFVKGICRGLGSEDMVSSPTFVFINEYHGKFSVFHVDLYRLDSVKQLAPLGLEELSNSGSVVLVEWPDLAESLLKYHYIIQCREAGDTTREFTIEERNDTGN
ncbi:MAG TPA: tRNA (adenosine(37)-N6)-threonylcarbamoyltransferase complex ATPase subunit type 1 TsaE [Candidatus Kapabacteria bacterium]|nr:tRNA (adenosine(37)-N6)-threonylcarbamoyltransferase complex ATPase subunit type 1 TsaE [Candidatus Kapabacteria bacterium]